MHWRWRLFITILLSHLLPIALYFFSTNYTAGQHDQWFTIFLTLALASILAWALYYSFSRPIARMSKDVEEMADGELNTDVFKEMNGPFRAIGHSLTVISSKLEEFTSRTKAESEVISSEANRLRMILNSINDGVLALDKDKNIILFNRAARKITGLDISDVAGKHINLALPLMVKKQLVISDWFDESQGADLQEKSWGNVAYQKSNGELLSLNIDALYVGADPNGVRMLITFHSYTEEQQIEDMKVDFVALAAHELRTPVAIIRGYLEILSQELGPQVDEEYREFIRKLDISASQLAGSINNILHVSHIEHGELNLQKEVSDWKATVTQACNELNIKAIERGKSIELFIEDNIPYVSVDKVSISEVINNLVDNAIKYSPKGGLITVNVRRQQNAVVTEVIDRGVGIPPSAVGRLFTKFYRSHRTRNSHRGTGLGLYMSKAIVEAHGGHIWVESKEGEGSSFGFELPGVAKSEDEDNNNDITRGIHGWIKNHSLYRG